MLSINKIVSLSGLALISLLPLPTLAEEPEEPAPPVVRSDRIEFDDRLIRGEGASSGAVYLFKRDPSVLPTLVPVRQSYRHLIVSSLLGERPLEPVTTWSDDQEPR